MNHSLLHFKSYIKGHYFIYFSHILLHFQTKYILDSFIELIPSKKGYGADHYIAYKRITKYGCAWTIPWLGKLIWKKKPQDKSSFFFEI